jgi:hypothetical protein
VPVNAETNCLAHALIIAIARVDNDPNYNSYRRGYKIPSIGGDRRGFVLRGRNP